MSDLLPGGTRIKDLQFWGGYGTASFTMKRGSFKIKDRVQERIPLTLTDNGERLTLSDARGEHCVAVTLSHSSGVARIELQQTAGEPFTRFWISLPARASERIFGCGETFSEFDLKGKTARIWVAEHQNLSRIMGKVIRNTLSKPAANRKLRFEKYETYYAQPTFTSSARYFVHVDSDAYMEFRFDKAEHLLYLHTMPKTLYIGMSETYEGLSTALSGVLGKQPLAPTWINDGLIIAVQGGTDAIKKKVETALAAGIPLVGVWSQDWCGARITAFGHQVMWNWAHDATLYPGLEALMAEMKSKGIRFLGYINPFMAIEGELYRFASARGFCIKDKDGKDYLTTTTTFPAAMIDFTNPQAYEWYKNVIKKNLIEFGLDGWMADFGEYMPVDAQLFHSDDNTQTHNTWPALWAQMNREVLEETGRQDEIFFFTRAGHTGTVRNSMMMWNGDQHVDWSEDDGLPSVITATLSLAMSGYGVTHSDIGGYTTMPKCLREPELLMRWAELAAFSPVMRCHEGNRPADNAQFDHNNETLTHFAKLTRVHVTLKDYINRCVLQNHEAGIPVMRPLFYHYDEEALYGQPYAYLLGRDLACYPVVVKGQTAKEVYLPEDEWVHLFTGAEYRGGKQYVECPMGCPPVFYRKASPDRELFEQVKKLHDKGITG